MIKSPKLIIALSALLILLAVSPAFPIFNGKHELWLWLCPIVSLPIAYIVGSSLSGVVSGAQIEKVNTQIGQLQEKLEEDFFTKLVNINFKYLDKYYLQTQVQADRSFYFAIIAAMISLAMVIFGIGLMYRGEAKPAYVSAGAGILGEFIAAVFFYLYNRTVLRMSEYHHKLVLTQNISLALKTADSLDAEEKKKALAAIIVELTKDVNPLLVRPAANPA